MPPARPPLHRGGTRASRPRGASRTLGLNMEMSRVKPANKSVRHAFLTAPQVRLHAATVGFFRVPRMGPGGEMRTLEGHVPLALRTALPWQSQSPEECQSWVPGSTAWQGRPASTWWEFLQPDSQSCMLFPCHHASVCTI